MKTGGSALAGKVHVDSEERLLSPFNSSPLSNKGLTALSPRIVGRVDTSRIILEQGSVNDLISIETTALVGLVELDNIGTVEIRASNVTAGLASVLAILGLYLDEVVFYAASLGKALGERGKGTVGADNAIVGRARTILNFLEKDEIGNEQLVDDLVNDLRQIGAVRGQVLGVIRGDGDALAGPRALKADRAMVGGGIADRSNLSKREDAVESEGVGDDAGDIAVVVAHPSVTGVLCAINGTADDNSLWIGV